MKNISIQKERIIQFIDYKGISKNKFYKETGVSNGVLDKIGGLSVDTLEKIYSTYNEINLEWLVSGEGEMIKNKKNHDIVTKVESIEKEDTNWEREYYKVLRELNECLKKNNELLEDKSAHQAS